MVETYWTDSADEIIVNSSDEPCDCVHDPCTVIGVCVGDINRGYVARCYFTWDGVTEGPITFSLLWDQGAIFVGGVFSHYEVVNGIYTKDTWSGTAQCGGGPPFHGFKLRVYCRSDQWYFDMLTPTDDGNDYANPSLPGQPGGATLTNASPMHVFGQISLGYYADDFPFCGKSGSYPGGNFLSDFHFDMTES